MAMKASTVILVELGGLKRTLFLSGPSLPLRGATWEQQTRVKTSFPAGNREGVQHVLGEALAPTEFEGQLRTNQLTHDTCKFVDETGTTQELTRANDVVDVLDSFRAAASLLRVSWGTDDGRQLVRFGRLTRVVGRYDRFDDIRWRATFEWTSRGAPSSKGQSSQADQQTQTVGGALSALNDVTSVVQQAGIVAYDPSNFLSASSASLGLGESLASSFTASALVSGFVGARASVSFGFGASAGFSASTNAGFGFGVSSSSSFGASSGFLAGVSASVSVTVGSIQAAVVSAQAYSADPAQYAAVAAGVGRTATLQLAATADLLGQTPPELLSAVPRPSAIARAAAYVSAVSSAVDAALAAALQVQQVARVQRSAAQPSVSQVDRAQAADAVQVYRSKGGETFASLSQRFYGTPDRGAVIAKANGISAFRIAPTPGTLLLVPTLSAKNAATRAA